MNSTARTAIDATVGSSPWDWQTFRAIRGVHGPPLVWHRDENDGPGRAYVALRNEETSAYKLLLGTGCRPFTIPDGLLGLWFPDSESIRLVGFDPDTLPDIPRPVRFTKLQIRYHAGVQPVESMLIPARLPPGSHRLVVPECMRSIHELLAVADYGPNRSTTIFSLRPPIGELTIYPQLWFDEMFPGGWEAITKVTRHPQRGTIIGGGPRIRPFELTEDGCRLAHWL